ncbi:hypothetical protein [Terrabacter sp. MAHUQ-38]|uniref:hypothetical protein n=1 Tax=unclassified Terrabacter TaxID=2630222 RepID=UPI00165E859B|nr:hypothetical protein [Terrabacter sp. MAHUQ-38]MBC9822818.1 hypothetical protein [Terrabacter sp. MAHUQ-38]
MTYAGQLPTSAAVLVVAAAPSGCAQPMSKPATAPGSTTTVVPGCPPGVIKPARRAVIDYTDFVVHNGVTYSSRPDRPKASAPTQLGSELFRVSCSFSSLNERTQSERPEPTEHSAAFIPAGSAVFELRGWPAACRLAAQHDGSWFVYIATIDTADA